MLRMPAVALAARVVLAVSRLNVPDAARRAVDEGADAAAVLVPWIRIGGQRRPGVVNAPLRRRQKLP
jgi:hypothetical protein